MLNAFRYSLENILNETLRNHTIKAATFSRKMYKRCGADESLVCVSLLNISPNTVTLAQWDYFVLSLIWFYNGEKRGANNRTKNTFFLHHIISRRYPSSFEFKSNSRLSWSLTRLRCRGDVELKLQIDFFSLCRARSLVFVLIHIQRASAILFSI